MFSGYNNNGWNNGGYNQQPMNYSSQPGNYSAGSIFNQGNNGFNQNNSGYNNNGIIGWFMSNLNRQIWELVNLGTLRQEFVNPMMNLGKQYSNDYIRFIEQTCRNTCGTDIENANNNVIIEAFSNIIGHIHQTLVNEQNRSIDTATNQSLNTLYQGNNRFGGQNNNNSYGYNNSQPQPMQYNNVPSYGQSYGVSDNTDIPARYRSSVNPVQQPQNNQVVDDPFSRYAQPVEPTTTTEPAASKTKLVVHKFKKTNVLEIIGRTKSTIKIPSKPFEEYSTDSSSTALSECATEKVIAGDVETAANIMASAVFTEYGIDLPIKNSESAEISKQCVINGANLSSEHAYRYNESVRPDTRIVDVAGDNQFGMESEEVSIIKANNNGTDRTIVCADLIDNDISIDEDALFETIRDGSLVDIAMSRGSEVHRCLSDSSDIALTISYNTISTLGIPFESMKPVYDNIKKLCTLHNNISTFNTLYDEIISVLYAMPRGYSEMLDELLTENINTVLANNAFSFHDGLDKPIRISKMINVFDLIKNNNVVMLKSEALSKFTRLIFDVLQDTFSGELLDPDDSYMFDYILDNETTSKEVAAHHKVAITSAEYHDWDETADRDLIAKLSTNIRKFTAITMRRHALVTTVQPAVKSNLMDWLFVYGDRSNHTTTNIDPMTMLIARTLDKFPTTTNIRFINRKTGGSMGNPVGDGYIGSTLDGYYGYMLTK